MDLNKISTRLDVKLDVYNKRPESLKFHRWTKCEVKIEAIKCLPCFLRVSIKSLEAQQDRFGELSISISINAPGVNISLATSRTKLYSYGLFWTHNRRSCFIYFALETELACRKHMKWLKKAMKNLDLHQQMVLEQRRNSRGALDRPSKQNSFLKGIVTTLGALPKVPDNTANGNFNSFPRVSDIYEEILEGQSSPRVSRRFSRASVASGIYEEMKPCPFNFHSVLEENLQMNTPPPLPPPRKRLNTFDNAVEGALRRSRTNPESELIKKGCRDDRFARTSGNVGREKRAESVSESSVCRVDDILNKVKEVQQVQVNYKEEILEPSPGFIKANKRNSFSSPDLSKINLLEIFDEAQSKKLFPLGDSAEDLFEKCDEVFFAVNNHNISSCSLDDFSLNPFKGLDTKRNSAESLNISEQLSANFNFSACNSSVVNLVGASGAVPSSSLISQNKILTDDLTGYCVMAPIRQKRKETAQIGAIATSCSASTTSTSSGHLTGSCDTPSTSSGVNCANIANDVKLNNLEAGAGENNLITLSAEANDNSTIYEDMEVVSPHANNSTLMKTYENMTPTVNKGFMGNLYENLLTFKATQELEHALPRKMCTSTPTDEDKAERENSAIRKDEGEESYYQTPRKSLISVDEKIPSYYPNSCGTLKTKRSTTSPLQTKVPFNGREKGKEGLTLGLKHLVNIKMQRERKENLYMSSPQKIMEQRGKEKKLMNAQRISENVYAVKQDNMMTFNNNKNNNNYNETEKSQHIKLSKNGRELIDLSLLPKIDFRFDDITNSTEVISPLHNSERKPSGIVSFTEAETEYERYFQASKNAARLLHKYATFAPKPPGRAQHQLQSQQSQPHQQLMVQPSYPKLASSILTKSSYSPPTTDAPISAKKFSSLPSFRKFDLSPIKMKIHNALQRH
ncbi:uncharacterized protein LOC119636689 [Glossina fuscipes]|uniref:Uncharacterized protein LOC119636689 n=1 Tax=Glossina fuscipes TaxID=7396 RepID=A0A9C5YVF3_9MUSC|nr:uncharacterized protein LOC119636689 [Glossina fuscipes]KAI9583051.1 hypothetical protein GQX74_012268 [Glossina fuscipes]